MRKKTYWLIGFLIIILGLIWYGLYQGPRLSEKEPGTYNSGNNSERIFKEPSSAGESQ